MSLAGPGAKCRGLARWPATPSACRSAPGERKLQLLAILRCVWLVARGSFGCTATDFDEPRSLDCTARVQVLEGLKLANPERSI
jgi:hypothetical protein